LAASNWVKAPRAWLAYIADPQRFEDLLARRALFDGGLGVKSDAVVAAHCDRDRQRDQLLGLGVERLGGERGLRDGGEGLHHLARPTAQAPQVGAEILRQRRPILLRHVVSLWFGVVDGAWAGRSSSVSQTKIAGIGGDAGLRRRENQGYEEKQSAHRALLGPGIDIYIRCV
jgi:hypothetical protein